MDDAADMIMTAALVDHQDAYLSTLPAELQGSASVSDRPIGAGGDLTNAVVSTLLGLDFSLITNLRRAPRFADGWQATLAPTAGQWAGLEITAHGDIFHLGTVELSNDWTAEVRRRGWSIVCAGALRVPDSRGALRALRLAASSGGLTGGRVPVIWRTRQTRPCNVRTHVVDDRAGQ